MISVTVLAKNSEATIADTLSSLQEFDEVILLDTGSTDKTVEIAKRFPNTKVCYHDFIGFGKTHNIASSLASHDFILSIDSNEIVSVELSKEILSLELDPMTTYSMLRKNYFRGKHMTGCAGWYPDWVCRLYHRGKTGFNHAKVHEKILQGTLESVRLKGTIDHTPYRKVGDFLAKMESYSSLFATQHAGKKKSSLPKAVFRGFFAFFKSYILKRGIFLGAEGLLISLYNGHTTFYKYVKLAEENKKLV